MLQMQKYHSIADVVVELRKAAEKKSNSIECEMMGRKSRTDQVATVKDICLDDEKEEKEKKG